MKKENVRKMSSLFWQVRTQVGYFGPAMFGIQSFIEESVICSEINVVFIQTQNVDLWECRI